MLKLREPLRRVDIQVSFFMALIVLFTSISIFFVCYRITYDDMILSLKDRVSSIYNYLEASLEEDTFVEINQKSDMEKDSYQEMKKLLEGIKLSTGVRYLYTAKETENGEFIYMIDGLDISAEDFRYPGDPIEPEIVPDMKKALSGETVLPDDIRLTDWGKVFITYLPVHFNGKIVGVVGIEFEAEHQYNTYRTLKVLTPVIILLFSLICVIFAVICFRRISNPMYSDMANTDYLTQMKSRNAFEVDIKNFSSKNLETAGVVVADLNNLKKVNDEFGHEAGDQYIRAAANTLKAAGDKQKVVYRTGGDEFAVFLSGMQMGELETYKNEVQKALEGSGQELGIQVSLSIGYALFDHAADNSFYETYKRADLRMYEDKKRYHRKDGDNSIRS